MPKYNNYKKNPKLFLSKVSKLDKNAKWLNKCTFLCADNRVVHDCRELECNITFEDKKGNLYNHQTEYDFNMYGVFVHTDCWKFVKNNFGIKLQYSHLPILNKTEVDKKLFDFINYGIIEESWYQDFDFIKLISSGNEELVVSPLKSNIVAKNIKKVFTKLKIRNELSRKSPITSATFYKAGTYKIGLNGNIWFIKGGKWIELKDTIIKEINTNLNKTKNIKFIGDINMEPLFFVEINKNDKKDNKIKIVTTNDYLNNKKF